MNNTCYICHAIIDEQWSALQNYVKDKTHLSRHTNLEFSRRCIFCYKDFLEFYLKREHEWYQEFIRAFENLKRSKIC